VNLEYFVIKQKGFAGYAIAILKLRKWLKENRFDLMHAHYGLCGWAAYLAKPKKIPLLLSYMGSDITPRTLLAKTNRALQNRAEHVIVKSANLAKMLRRKDGVSLIPNGVDLERFVPRLKEDARTSLGLSSEGKIVLFLANPKDRNKNFQLLERAFKLIQSAGILLLMPFPLEPMQVPLYLNASDVLVSASLSEGSPNVIKEAMACNCPIVTTNVGDVCEIIGDTPGCWITDFTPDEMAAKIKNALDFGKRTVGRERIVKLGLDSAAIAKKIISLYESQLKT
jgi:glycosyltransferase involved in cell wall biosynthesis